jgi:CheY-like chemotaxis protein
MRPAHRPILLLEDDRVDAMTVRRSLEELRVTNPLVHLENGEEGLSYLRDRRNPLPCIVLLDLNMPRMNGIDFLQSVKLDDTLKLLPVVVLTTSDQEKDKVTSFRLGVAGYIRKPVDYRRFVETMRTVNCYWTLSEHPL